MAMNKPIITTSVLLLCSIAGAGTRGTTGPGIGGTLAARQASRQQLPPKAQAAPADDQDKYEKQLSQQLERLLAQLRAATTANEKERLERAIVDFVREELRGTWSEVEFDLNAVDAKNHTIRVTIARTTLMLEPLPLRKDATVWVDGKKGRLVDLKAGTPVSLQLAAKTERPVVVGIRATSSRLDKPTADKIARLIRQLSSDNFEERAAASKALEAIGRPALPALRQAEASDDAEVRRRAKGLIQAQRDQESIWHCSASHDAPPDLARRCSVREVKGKMQLTNESGNQTEAVVRLDQHRVELIAHQWGGLKGQIEIDKAGVRIKWANGSKWTQKRP
jgi:hypothetical protein